MNKDVLIVLGPILSVILAVLMVWSGWSVNASITAGVTFLCAQWWVSEVIPIPATSLIPLAIFPLLGVLSPSDVASAYGSPLILLLMGGFILSTAMERSGAHRQIALHVVNLIGAGSHARIVFGFMCASALLSMWISNTATTLMLLPIALAVLQYANSDKLSIALMLGICYAASVGGMGTPIGTPPNLIFLKVYEENTGTEVSFVTWMFWAVPIVVLLIPAMALWLTRDLKDQSGGIEMPSAERWSREQKRVLTVFVLTALAWMTRSGPNGGWSHLLGLEGANDASVALCAVVLMFVLPSGDKDNPRRKLLDWEAANRIPWGMLFLFAGGIAIAKAFTASGLAAGMASHFGYLASMPVFVMMLIVCVMVTFLTEITSNTATTSLLMPILAVAAAAAGIDPLLMMVPAAMSASCAFMLPVATAPNAIVFGSGRVPILAMMRRGFLMNILGVVVISSICFILLGGES